jgi:hypothetical protein
MNQRRVVGILQELAAAHARIGALSAELAEAFAEELRRKPRARKRIEPKSQPSKEAVDSMRRTLRAKGLIG